MTYTLPPKLPIDKHTPTGIVIYGYTAEQVIASYDRGLEDTVIALTKLIEERDSTQLVNDQHAETILWQPGRISEMIDERDALRAAPGAQP